MFSQREEHYIEFFYYKKFFNKKLIILYSVTCEGVLFLVASPGDKPKKVHNEVLQDYIYI